METFPLEVFDTLGRLVARVLAQAPGIWDLHPAATWPNGLYFVRARGIQRPVVLLR